MVLINKIKLFFKVTHFPCGCPVYTNRHFQVIAQYSTFTALPYLCHKIRPTSRSYNLRKPLSIYCE